MSLKEYAEARGFTGYRLSKISGVPLSTVSGMWSGRTKLANSYASTVCQIAKALGTTAEALLAMEKEGEGIAEKDS